MTNEVVMLKARIARMKSRTHKDNSNVLRCLEKKLTKLENK